MRERYYRTCEKAYKRIACNLGYMQVLTERSVEAAKRAGDLSMKRQLINLGKKMTSLEDKAVECQFYSEANAREEEA